ncbi:hypothetical protein AAG570_006044 [Ranatra chinensis]|uniref:Uso1/p115-like vesicle tethering protein C-terminal domain-containing protein n=1 Tax=Ranatra chinensis TaxID=642074 RepID=A0ABD0YIM2_9HEMI
MAYKRRNMFQKNKTQETTEKEEAFSSVTGFSVRHCVRVGASAPRGLNGMTIYIPTPRFILGDYFRWILVIHFGVSTVSPAGSEDIVVELGKLRLDCGSKNDEIKKLKDDVTRLESEKSKLQSELERIAASNEAQELRAQIAKLMSDQDDLLELLADQDRKLGAYKEKLKSLGEKKKMKIFHRPAAGVRRTKSKRVERVLFWKRLQQRRPYPRMTSRTHLEVSDHQEVMREVWHNSVDNAGGFSTGTMGAEPVYTRV